MSEFDKRGVIALDPFFKPERPCSDGVSFHLGLHVFWQDDRVPTGQIIEEHGIDGTEGDPDGVVIDHLNRRDVLVVLLVGLRFVLCIPSQIESIFHISRGERLTIMELDPSLQMKGVYLPILRDVPAFGKSRDDLAVAIKLHQPLKEIVVNHTVDNGRGVCCGIESWRFSF